MDPGHLRETMSLDWPGNIWCPPKRAEGSMKHEKSALRLQTTWTDVADIKIRKYIRINVECV